MSDFTRQLGWIVVIVLVACSASVSLAQTDPNLLIKPWKSAQEEFDTSTEAVVEAANPSKEDHADDIQLSSYHFQGRWRLFPDQPATPRLGYDVLYFDVNTHDKALPRHLWDGTVGFAQPVAQINNYFVVVTGATGYSGDTPFSDPHAQFFTGNLIVGREFSKDRALVIALNYDGNRSFLPDVPIPAFAYADRYNSHLSYVLGFPLDSITYEPLSGLQINVGYQLLSTFIGKFGYEFDKHYSVFAEYTDRLTAFHLSDLPADRRLFLQEHRAEAGFRWNPTKLIRVSIGGGWAFGQEFSTGFDDRGTNPLRHLRDGPFAALNVELGL
jgi:hypothetical protein